MNRREELAWAAGFIDGEGSIVGGLQLTITVFQQDRHPLDRLVHIFGTGTIKPVKRGTRGHIGWVWSKGSFEGTQAIIAQLWPFLSRYRRNQAKTALTAYLARPGKRKGVHSPCFLCGRKPIGGAGLCSAHYQAVKKREKLRANRRASQLLTQDSRGTPSA